MASGSCVYPIDSCLERTPYVPFCHEGDAATCDDRGLEMTLTECISGCVEGICASVDDDCPQGEQLDYLDDCSGSCKQSHSCINSPLNSVTNESGVVRLPSASALQNPQGLGCEATGVFVSIPTFFHTRIEIPSDWLMSYGPSVPTDIVSGEAEAMLCRGDGVGECVSIPEGGPTRTMLLFTPRSIQSAERNIIIERSHDPLPCF